MDYEWDTQKAAANKSKHGVRFADAATVFEDDFALIVKDDSKSEEREIAIGMDASGRVLIVIYTWRGENIRLISARKATRSERMEYEENR